MKKMYWTLDNSDARYILDSLDACMEIIKNEATDVKQDDKIQPDWSIQTIWLTEEEFNNLPEAD